MAEGVSASLYRTIEAKTADYYIQQRDIGKIFTNRGASGAIVFYTPPVSATKMDAGWWCEIVVVADQSVTISSLGSADNLNAFNDAAADSIAFSTTAEKVGAALRIVWDGTSWLVFVHLAAETQTPTVA